MNESEANCAGCGHTAVLVAHHWYELPDLERHERQVCARCNAILSSYRFYPPEFYSEHRDQLHHILPPWHLQKKVILEVIAAKNAKVIVQKLLKNRGVKVKKDGREILPSPRPPRTADEFRSDMKRPERVQEWVAWVEKEQLSYAQIADFFRLTEEAVHELLGQIHGAHEAEIEAAFVAT